MEINSSAQPPLIRQEATVLQQHPFAEASKKRHHESANQPIKSQVDEVLESVNHMLKPLHTRLKFEMHENLNEYYITLVDTDTKEVIREIPPKKMLDAYYAMLEQFGIVIDKKV
ncbi:flagellar protein FlaG [Bacillaceae bacterium SIJ1]|uniref:flagellar protein FlaG n=1 Tax=Litoribacterium kuwaitense TaxID=1398745 RepID=UPI0013ECE4E1|nr:flagellar protein FlaG [Litoribacterium kuwaitense]NGP44930.1 flagellar protein FlaG [Litoribacterium kuwaitense]